MPSRFRSTIKILDWNKCRILKQYGPLFLLCDDDTKNKDFLIIYTRLQQNVNDNNKPSNVLWQTNNEQDALKRFGYLEKLLSTSLTQSNLYRPKSLKFLEDLINTMKDHPNWNDVLIAANVNNGLLEFFKKGNFSQAEISVQFAPDFLTPLHLSVLQHYRMTTERILQFNPNVNLVDHQKNTVLHIATTSHLDIFKILLNQANIRNLLRIENRFGWNPIELICINSKKDHLIHLMRNNILTSRLLTIVDKSVKNSLLPKLDDKKIIHFNEIDINSIDFSQINLGGCPLHWATKPDFIRKFVECFDLETPNLKNESSLISMIKNNRHNCAITLLIHGADVNKPDSNGDSPLHLAVMSSNYLLVKALIIFDSDISIKNNLGQNPHQLALDKVNRKSISQEMIKIFDDYFEAKNKKTITVSESNKFIKYFEIKIDKFQSESRTAIFENKNQDSNSSLSSKKSRLICMDGGGVKGLFTVQMMIELEKYLKKDLIDYFDWISGTSTGSMISFAMTNKKTLLDIRKLYFTFKDEILQGSRPYNTTKLENLFRNQLGADLSLKDVLNLHKKHLIITATRVDHYPPTLQLFCSHGCSPPIDVLPNQQQNDSLTSIEPVTDMPVWHALRASCAAPTYFHHFPPYIDGGLVSNNPTLDSMVEFFRYHESLQKDELKIDKIKKNAASKIKSSSKNQKMPKLEIVLSFGTGLTKSIQKNFAYVFDKFNYFLDFRNFIRDLSPSPWILGNELASQMKTQVTNCNDHVINRSASWCNSLDILYFRINAPFSKKIALDESKNEELIPALWEVKLYCLRMSDYFEKIAQVLEQN